MHPLSLGHSPGNCRMFGLTIRYGTFFFAELQAAECSAGGAGRAREMLALLCHAIPQRECILPGWRMLSNQDCVDWYAEHCPQHGGGRGDDGGWKRPRKRPGYMKCLQNGERPSLSSDASYNMVSGTALPSELSHSG